MAESSSQAAPPQDSQYHHFIPRFLLRNFANFKNPGSIVPKTSKKTKNRAPKPQRLTILDLEAGDFRQGDVSDTFGIVDMYRDVSLADRDQQKLERELSVLESAAGEVVAYIKRMYDAGKGEVQLIRKERNLLRRFLFIVMYRNSTFARRFKKSKEDYDSDDRESMLAYMDAKGFQTPQDVWFANIRAFVEADLDLDSEALSKELKQRAYPMDAVWFALHVQAYFLAICTPKKTADEFLLTQNAYSIFEGPSGAGAYLEYHRFAPVSPKIMIVLRSLLIPLAGVDEAKESRQMLLELVKTMYPDPKTSGSWLEDLPITRARNNYSQVVNGKIELLPTKISKDKHIFYFKFSPLDHEHVQKINLICLEQASETSTIVYKSPDSLRVALDYYLTDKTPGFKQVLPNDPNCLLMVLGEDGHLRQRTQDKMLPYLQLLLKFARQLGSTVDLEYNAVDPRAETTVSIPAMRDVQKALYEELGGTPATYLADVIQAKRIVRLITKVDFSIRENSAEVKDVVLRNREDLIATLPSTRVWLAIKHLRHLVEEDINSPTLSFEITGGKEDAIAGASRVFKANSLARTMYPVFDIDHFLDVHPGYGLVNELTLDSKGAMHIRQEKELVFNKPGSIRNCGIVAVEKFVRCLATQPLPGREAIGRTSLYRVLSDEQLSEIQMRQGAEVGFDGLLEDMLGGEELLKLKDGFFQHLYRSEFGGRMHGGELLVSRMV